MDDDEEEEEEEGVPSGRLATRCTNLFIPCSMPPTDHPSTPPDAFCLLGF